MARKKKKQKQKQKIIHARQKMNRPGTRLAEAHNAASRGSLLKRSIWPKMRYAGQMTPTQVGVPVSWPLNCIFVWLAKG